MTAGFDSSRNRLIWVTRQSTRLCDCSSNHAVEGVTVDHELVTSGPYRYVRHPIYGSFPAIAVGSALTAVGQQKHARSGATTSGFAESALRLWRG